MQRFLFQIEKGLSRKTHADADIKCWITYVQDLPNGKGNLENVKIEQYNS